ncbi:MAG: 3-oxoacyl-ACP synthase [Bacteroidetes bacterium]|nr:MAG: 3-oxoacyl-ACP synthase [Bacteroidota bacterium]
MPDKSSILNVLKLEIDERISSLEKALENSRMEMANDTKSTAGDKHETGRAMAQLEQEKLGKQVLAARELKQAVAQIDSSKSHSEIQFGSLVKASNGYFFFSVGIGKLIIENETVFCLTMTSPLGIALRGKKVGDVIEFNGQKISILNVE